MSQDESNNNVSKKLKEKRYSYYYKHILNTPVRAQSYEEVIWNSGDYQFLALWTKEGRNPNLRHNPLDVHLHVFRYYYGMWTKAHSGEVTHQYEGCVIRHDGIGSLIEFLNRKPTDEVFTIPYPQGGYHLSFGKRSLFGGVELNWKFLYDQEEWGKLYNLPRKERKDKLTDFKQNEERKNFWFDNGQVTKLKNYLKMTASANS